MSYIIGTAGHIDHGKTSLVKSLTGQDTDRLKEEKERGISIDLGFAHFDLPDGTRAGVVDVPGHERFIRNMLAGAHGVDLVLFTVAADDGVMPQTEEHLDILHLLGVRRAIFVVTKIDLAPESRIRDVEDEIRILVAGTVLENASIVRFSFVTGEGLESIRRVIIEMLRQTDRPRSLGYFRLPVDRVFVLQGHGLVVTGTATSGEIHLGDRVRCQPGGQMFRVRNLHVHNEPVEIAAEGQRIALNLTGPDTVLARGHVICDERLTLTSERFDTWVELRPSATAGLKDHQRVRVHLGTAERIGRVLLLSKDEIKPKESTYCQVTVEEPLHVLRGDHFILRDETAQRTLGGGVVVHPWAGKHKRTESDLLQKLTRLHAGDLGTLICTFVDDNDEFAVPIDRLCQFLNLQKQDVETQVERAASIRAINLEGELLYISAAKWRQASEHLTRSLGEFHAAHPLAPGMDIEALRAKMAFEMSPRVFRAFVEQMEAGGVIVRQTSLLRLSTHTVRLRDEEHTLVERIKSLLGANPVAPPDLAEMERHLGISRAKLTDVVRVMEREKVILRINPELCFLTDAIERVVRTLHEQWGDQREITPAAFRDFVGTTRKFAIPLLQYFDRAGVTVRIGETRRLRKPSAIGRQ